MRLHKVLCTVALCVLGGLTSFAQSQDIGWLASHVHELHAVNLIGAQESAKIGSLKFTPPKGWKQTSASSRVLLAFAPPDLPTGKTCQVRVFQDETTTEVFKEWFTRRWNALMSGKPKLRTSDVMTQKAGPAELILRSGAYEESGGESYALLIAATIEGHNVLVSYEANDYPTIEKYQDDVYAMFGTMDLETGSTSATGTPPIATPPPSGDPVERTVPPSQGSTAPYKSGDPLQESQRLNRLSEIAQLLQDPKEDAVALITEGAKLCGFAIWNEDRAKIADPSGAPALKLAVTDTEIKEYAQMFRAGHSVVLSDLIGMLDVAYKGNGSQPSCGPIVMDWLENGGRSGNASVRALIAFVQSLGAARGGGSASTFVTGTETLDPIQSLLIMRVLTEEIGGALRKVIAKEKPPLYLATLNPMWQETEAPGWAEDGFVGGVTGLWDSITGLVGKGEAYAAKVGKANAILSIIKFIATYIYLKGEVRIEAPGQPLVRTKGSRDSDAGEMRRVVAKFWIDGSKVTDWMKDNRKIVALAGLDLDMPKTGVLKGVPTEWKIGQGTLVRTQLIRTVRGTGGLDKIVTDAKGEATVEFEGCPQPVELDPKKVMPLQKRVKITVTPAVKEVTIQQDLVDAVTGAIGIKGGPVGFITPLMEMLYRMKWTGSESVVLQVRDWQQAETIGQFDVSIKANGHDFSRDSAMQMTIDRSLSYKDVGMLVVGGDLVPQIDPRVFEHASPEVRKQMEAGMKQMAELAKKRQFIGQQPGEMHMSINDLSWNRGPDGCELAETTNTTTWVGAENREFESTGANHDMFQISVDLEKKIATVTCMSGIKIKYVNETRKNGKVIGHDERQDQMGMYNGLTFAEPYSGSKPIEIPLQETKVIESDETNYYGALSIPVTFGPTGKFKGTVILSYSVTRKVVKKP